MSEKNEFEELFDSEEFNTADEESVVLNNEEVKEKSKEVEMTPDDFMSYIFLKTPEVGESLSFTISKVVNKPGREITTKTGDKFWTGIKKRDEPDSKRVEYILETDGGERFTIQSWDLYGALFGKGSVLMAKVKENKTFNGITIRITHIYNGKDATLPIKDLMKIRDFKTTEEAEQHKKKVAKAKSEGGLYKVEVL